MTKLCSPWICCSLRTVLSKPYQQCGKDDGVEDVQLGTGRDLPLVPEDATEGLECFRGFANSGGLSHSHSEQCCQNTGNGTLPPQGHHWRTDGQALSGLGKRSGSMAVVFVFVQLMKTPRPLHHSAPQCPAWP